VRPGATASEFDNFVKNRQEVEAAVSDYCTKFYNACASFQQEYEKPTKLHWPGIMGILNWIFEGVMNAVYWLLYGSD